VAFFAAAAWPFLRQYRNRFFQIALGFNQRRAAIVESCVLSCSRNFLYELGWEFPWLYSV